MVYRVSASCFRQVSKCEYHIYIHDIADRNSRSLMCSDYRGLGDLKPKPLVPTKLSGPVNGIKQEIANINSRVHELQERKLRKQK